MLDIDDKYDSKGDWLFPYATPYASQDGSGWYVMPEKDDYVRVLFPSDDTAAAYATSTINTLPADKPEEKRFKAPKGKEILFTEKGIQIICKNEKIYIDLSDSEGIKLVSSGALSLVADANVTLKANKEVEITGSKVTLGSSGASVEIGPGKITLSGPQIALA